MKNYQIPLIVGLVCVGVILVLMYRKLILSMVTNPTKMSSTGKEWLIKDEGFKLTAYKDTAKVIVDGTPGYWTIGVGHLINSPSDREKYLQIVNGTVKPKTITKSQVISLFESDLQIYEKAVSDNVKVPIKQHQFDALVAFSFNVGVRGFKNSTLLRAINTEGNTKAGFAGYSLGGSHTMRRLIESKLYHDGVYIERYPLTKLNALDRNKLINQYLA